MNDAQQANEIEILYTRLLTLIGSRVYGHDITFSKNKINEIIKYLSSINNIIDSESRHTLIRMYLDLFKDSRYVQEVYIWDKDYSKEESNNRPLREIQEQIWTLLYPSEYVKVRRLQELYPQLISIFERYSRGLLYHINVLKGIVDYLNSLNFDKDDLKLVLSDIYDMSSAPLFSMHSALAEFYIHENVSDDAKALNQELDYIRDEIYEILKDYIKS